MFARRLTAGLCLMLLPWTAAAGRSLLEAAVETWLGERDHWAFTQRAVEYDNSTPRERLERYDPSLPGDRRWTLLAINGRPPTRDEHEAWAKKKFRKNRRRFDAPIGEYFDFARAQVVREDAATAQFEVPLRRDKSWLFQVEKVRVLVTVNKQTRALEHLAADVREPLKVLLGLARITKGQLDLSFLQVGDGTEAGPESVEPAGRATVTVSKFGGRAEFTWFDFKRVEAEGAAAKG